MAVKIVFVLTPILTVFAFYKASNHSKITLIILLLWLILQTFIGLSGFYAKTDTTPPRFSLLITPPLLLILGLFAFSKGREYLDGLNIKYLTILHTIRIPVELVLFALFMNKAVPELMTFEGRNLDILSGLTAPFIFYFSFIKQSVNRKMILIWNFVCLSLLINIVVHAVLSAPSPFQKFAFDQPNIGILYFPFNWLPACVVPLVLLSHLASIRQLTQEKKIIH